jgi:hypothetical protein
MCFVAITLVVVMREYFSGQANGQPTEEVLVHQKVIHASAAADFSDS